MGKKLECFKKLTKKELICFRETTKLLKKSLEIIINNWELPTISYIISKHKNSYFILKRK